MPSSAQTIHDMAAVNLHSGLADPNFVHNLLIELSEDNEPHHLSLKSR